jgi:hypothetical protein
MARKSMLSIAKPIALSAPTRSSGGGAASPAVLEITARRQPAKMDNVQTNRYQEHNTP